MGAIWRSRKRYFLEYESDRRICGEYTREGGRANSIKALKAAIKRIRKEDAENNPRNFVIFDTCGECKEWEHVPAVYREE